MLRKFDIIITHPLLIFIVVWLMSVFLYSLRIAWFMPDDVYLLYKLFFVSTVYFAIGFYPFQFIKKKSDIEPSRIIMPDRLKLLTLTFSGVIVAILLFNLKYYGYPPLFSLFHLAAFNYMEYGNFKGLLCPMLSILFLISVFEKKRYLNVTMKGFPILIFILYMTRGFLISTLIQYFFLLLILKKINFKKTLLISIAGFILIISTMSIIGGIRTGNEHFKEIMEIKNEYRHLNSGILWTIGYISFPFANLISIIKNSNELFMGSIIFNNSIPAFLQHNSYLNYYNSLLPNKANTVSTYLGLPYLDFGIIGLICMNYLLGLIGGMFYASHIKRVYHIPFAIYLSVLTLLFFYDFLFYFPFLVETLLAVVSIKFIQKVV
ncbi:MAG TPA: oligosaccharide repeat unit polymerase [Ignavibacteria bacterium]|nr:oligosaccharide repeat unit polymerase [Ignavibacteria bacterium]